jgi:GxxExxY protein
MGNLILEDETYAILGACFEVYKEKGCGFLEAVYQECLAIEFQLRGIPFIAQQELSLYYKAQRLTQTYRPDFVCYDAVVVELKAVSDISAAHRAQLHNYLHATGQRVGLLINFGHHPKLGHERIIV